jgi:hypothetical protein
MEPLVEMGFRRKKFPETVLIDDTIRRPKGDGSGDDKKVAVEEEIKEPTTDEWFEGLSASDTAKLIKANTPSLIERIK